MSPAICVPNGVITTRVSFIVAEQRVNGGELAQRNTFLFSQVPVTLLCLYCAALLSLKETVILFGPATQIVALLVLLALCRSIASMEVLLWMVVIEARVGRVLRRHRTLARQACPQGNADGLRPFGQSRACKQGRRYTGDIPAIYRYGMFGRCLCQSSHDSIL